MDEIDASLLASYQIKHWSVRYFVAQFLEGHYLLFRELKRCLGRIWARLFEKRTWDESRDDRRRRQQDHHHSSSSAANRPALVISRAAQVGQDVDNQPTSLKYGIIILSKLAHAIGLWIPSFTLDISLDLQMSRFFVIFSYYQLSTFFATSLSAAKWILEPSLVQILDKIAPSVMRVLTISVFVSEICYISYRLLSCAYIVYQRNFIQDFFLYRCTMITLPRRYQRRKILTLFSALYVFSLTSEPLYAFLSLYYDLEQPRVWPHLNRGLFYGVKWVTIALTSFTASLLSACGFIIPLMTCFLILASAKHLKSTMEKQLLRYRRVAGGNQHQHQHLHQLMRMGQPSSRLEALLDKRTRKIIHDYSCHTLTMDWPEMAGDTRSQIGTHAEPVTQTGITRLNPSSSASNSTTLSSSTTINNHSSSSSSLSSSRSAPDNITALMSLADYANQQQLSTSASGLLFLYKNLLKNMSEIKQMIRMWESKFANFHLIYTLINCLIVTQWVTVAFTEARGLNHGDASESGRGEPSAIIAIDSYSISPFVVRIIGGVITFIISNIYIMLLCDCLSRRLIKIKAQLFKMNIDLTSSHVVLRSPSLGRCCSGGQKQSRIAIQQHKTAGGPALGQYAEINQIWSLYDQVDRLASTTLFKFSSDTYYTKRCLLDIFSRSLSVLLLFIQIIEMFHYA